MLSFKPGGQIGKSGQMPQPLTTPSTAQYIRTL